MCETCSCRHFHVLAFNHALDTFFPILWFQAFGCQFLRGSFPHVGALVPQAQCRSCLGLRRSPLLRRLGGASLAALRACRLARSVAMRARQPEEGEEANGRVGRLGAQGAGSGVFLRRRVVWCAFVV